jgi:hypothetical protein
MHAKTVVRGLSVTVAVASLVSFAAIGMACGALSAAAAPRVDPTPAASGSSHVSFTVPDTASPSPAPSSPGAGSVAGSAGTGAGGAGVPGSASGSPVGSTASSGTSTPVCVPGSSTPAFAPNPTSTPAPLALKAHRIAQGDDVLVTAEGFQPGEKIVAVLYPTPVSLGVFTVRPTGQVYAEFPIPRRTQLGSHTLEVIGYQDCRVAASTIDVVSPTGPGVRTPPWTMWIIVGGGIGLAAGSVLLAVLLGWLPNIFAVGVAVRPAP